MNDRDRLEAPFSAQVIRTRALENRTKLRYVEGAEYIKRLNEVFNGDWSFDIESHSIYEDEVIVKGRLKATRLVKRGAICWRNAMETALRKNLSKFDRPRNLQERATGSTRQEEFLLERS